MTKWLMGAARLPNAGGSVATRGTSTSSKGSVFLHQNCVFSEVTPVAEPLTWMGKCNENTFLWTEGLQEGSSNSQHDINGLGKGLRSH